MSGNPLPERERGALEDAAATLFVEGFGPGGVAFLVEVSSAEQVRAVADLGSIFEQFHGGLAENGKITPLFEQKGTISIAPDSSGGLPFIEIAVAAGAEEMATDDGGHLLLTTVDNLAEIAAALIDGGAQVEALEEIFLPKSTVEISDTETAVQVLDLLSNLDSHPAAMNVFANFDIPDAVMDSLVVPAS